MSVSDEQIGKNLTRLRGELSQADLADKMRERGYKWSQATVWAIEKGERPLRLTEAQDVASVLNTFASRLTSSDAISQVDSAQHAVARAHRELEAAIEKYHEAQLQLALTAETSEVRIEGTPREEMVLDWLRLTAAEAERNIRASSSARDQAEEATWAYLRSKKSGEVASELLEQLNEGGETLDGVFIRAFNKSWEEFEDFNLVPESRAERTVEGPDKDELPESRHEVS